MKKKDCLECGETLRGRSDKKFCTDMCRNTYNNRLNGNCSNLIRNVNGILRKNRRILEQLFAQQSFMLNREELAERGFNFNYVTHRKPIDRGLIGQFCYEFGYTLNEKQIVMLVLEPEIEFRKRHNSLYNQVED
jgi:hypothetical protein